jgi:hypothetical protein
MIGKNIKNETGKNNIGYERELKELDLMNRKCDVANKLNNLEIEIDNKTYKIFNHNWILENVFKIDPKDLGWK